MSAELDPRPAATPLPAEANGPVERGSLTGAAGLQPRQATSKSNSELAYEQWIASADPAARLARLLLTTCVENQERAETVIKYVYISAYITGREAANSAILGRFSASMNVPSDGRPSGEAWDEVAKARERDFARIVAGARP